MRQASEDLGPRAPRYSVSSPAARGPAHEVRWHDLPRPSQSVLLRATEHGSALAPERRREAEGKRVAASPPSLQSAQPPPAWSAKFQLFSLATNSSAVVLTTACKGDPRVLPEFSWRDNAATTYVALLLRATHRAESCACASSLSLYVCMFVCMCVCVCVCMCVCVCVWFVRVCVVRA